MLLLNKISKNFKFYILTFFSLTTILTLSSTPENFLNNNLIKNNLYENILFFKSTLPLVIFATLIIITIKEFRSLLLVKNNFIFILFIFLILSQITGTIIYPQNDIKNLYYIIPEINIMLITLIFLKISNKKKLKFYFNLNLLVFFFIFIYFFFIYFKYYLLFDNNFYSTWANIDNNESVPRPTGMARLAMLFSVYYFCSYILHKKHLFFLILFNFIIFAFQSRVVILSLLLISLIFILIKERYSIVKTFKNLILIFIIPFIISVFIDFSKREILFKSNDSKNESIRKFSGIRVLNHEIYSTNFTSNRKEDWQNILNNFDKQKVFGYGVHGDRILIKQTASNGFLYSLVSGGYLAVITYCIICIYSLYLVNLALLKKKFNKYSWFASSMIIFFLIRSLVENSFTIVSFDFIIFFSSIFYLEKTFFYKSKFKIKA